MTVLLLYDDYNMTSMMMIKMMKITMVMMMMTMTRMMMMMMMIQKMLMVTATVGARKRYGHQCVFRGCPIGSYKGPQGLLYVLYFNVLYCKY